MSPKRSLPAICLGQIKPVIRVCALGDYAHRQPLAYPQIRAACCADLRLVDRPEAADLVVVAHSKDLDRHADRLAALSADQRIVLLSEEPFWDTVWGHDPLQRDLQHPTQSGALAVRQLNHHTSPIFAFQEIPYFLLTETYFATRYGLWFSETARVTPAKWEDHFRQMSGHAAFIMAHRQSPRYDLSFPETELRSLCNERTALAEACAGPGVLCQGQRWQDTPPRQTLVDWHLDKFLQLKNQFRYVGAIENTHAAQYVTEKIFDAWAVGAIPLYMAGPTHRIHDLALPGSWLNMMDVPRQEVAAHLSTTTQTPEFCETYSAQHQALAARFGSDEIWQAELKRLRGAIVQEFTRVLERQA